MDGGDLNAGARQTHAKICTDHRMLKSCQEYYARDEQTWQLSGQCLDSRRHGCSSSLLWETLFQIILESVISVRKFVANHIL